MNTEATPVETALMTMAQIKKMFMSFDQDFSFTREDILQTLDVFAAEFIFEAFKTDPDTEISSSTLAKMFRP